MSRPRWRSGLYRTARISKNYEMLKKCGNMQQTMPKPGISTSTALGAVDLSMVGCTSSQDGRRHSPAVLRFFKTSHRRSSSISISRLLRSRAITINSRKAPPLTRPRSQLLPQVTNVCSTIRFSFTDLRFHWGTESGGISLEPLGSIKSQRDCLRSRLAPTSPLALQDLSSPSSRSIPSPAPEVPGLTGTQWE